MHNSAAKIASTGIVASYFELLEFLIDTVDLYFLSSALGLSLVHTL